MGVKPSQYQKDGVRDMEDFLGIGGGALLADDMGLGKTLQALWLLRRGKAGEMYPALITCPASVKYGWEHQAATHMGMRVQVLEGRKPPSGGFGVIMPQITVINPDILPAWLPHLKKCGFKTLVMDECQMFANPGAKCTQAIMSLARHIPFRLALSGTPLLNAPGELWPTLHMLRPDAFNSLFSFADEFCKPRKRFGRWEFKGAQNLDKLHALLRRTLMVRRLKEDVLPDLPKKMRSVLHVDISDRNEYHRAKGNFIGWLRDNYEDKGKVKRATKAAAVTRVGYLLRLAAQLKARAVVQWANKFLEEYPEEKLVLFAIHHKMIDLLQRRINAKCAVVSGSVSGRRRHLAKEQFINDPATRVFIGNIKAAGTGIDGLQEVCQNLAFAELWWVPAAMTQAEDRIYRIGQTNVTWITYLVAGGTIEDDLCRIIQEKHSNIRGALDGQEGAGDLDIFDQLISTMEDM